MKHSHIFMRFPEGKYRALTFTFDDGSNQDKWLMEVLKKNGLKATFNLNMGLLPPVNSEEFDFDKLDEAYFPVKSVQHRLSLEEIKELYVGSGMELASHGYLHAQLPLLNDDHALYELIRDRKALEDIMGVPVRGYAYPQGDFDDRSIELLKRAGFVYARTAYMTHRFDLPTDFMRWGPTCGYCDPAAMDLAEEFLTVQPGPGVYFGETRAKLYNIFAHSYEFEFRKDYDVMEKLCEKLGGHDDEVWYCTNIEYFRYDKAFRDLDFNIDQTVVYNPSCIPVWIYANNNTVKVGPGETVNI